jgi:cysteine desulfurase family protein
LEGGVFMEIIYFDNAASSWPKPRSVSEKVAECIQEYGANPGRGGHQLSMRASKVIYKTRVKLAQLFGIQNPNDIFFTMNATMALNMAIKGILKSGDHVITTTLEHNSVRRPLEYMKKVHGVEITYIKPEIDGFVINEFKKAIKQNTRLIAVSHASNLTGMIAPIKEIGLMAKEYQIPFLVDGSQSAGILPINVEEMNISLLGFPGHKGLYGPQGTGGLYVHPDLQLEPLLHGGTGSHSELIEQPETRPDRYESGTLNTPGIAGLLAGVEFVLDTGVEEIRKKEWELTQYTLQKFEDIQGIEVYGPPREIERVAVIAFNMLGMDASEVAYILDQEYGIAVRSGFHCTPLGHETAGTSEIGAIRISYGYYNTREQVDQLIMALRDIQQAILEG